jgi:hypothetical protein
LTVVEFDWNEDMALLISSMGAMMVTSSTYANICPRVRVR